MIKEFADAFMAEKDSVRAKFKAKHPGSYTAIVEAVVETLRGVYDYNSPDPERVHMIDDGDYQGTLLFLVAADSYQPDEYWYVRVDYGSCSGCDTLEAISDYSSEPPTDEPPTDEQADEYTTLALHVVQGMAKLPSWRDDPRTVSPKGK